MLYIIIDEAWWGHMFFFRHVMVGKSQAENHFLFGPVPGDQAGQLP